MNTDLTHCPNCGEKLKGGFLGGGNTLLSTAHIALINEYGGDTQYEAMCDSCGTPPYLTALGELDKDRKSLREAILRGVNGVPIVTIHSPLDWKYSALSLVTAQCVMGTGVVAEIASSFTDLFGTQSNAYNQKLKTGEDACKAMLRAEAIKLGANAIVAADVDYGSVGGEKSMLMICMSGTAVRLQNQDILGDGTAEAFQRMLTARPRLERLNSIARELNLAVLNV